MSTKQVSIRRFFRSVVVIALLAAIGCSKAPQEKTPEDIEKVRNELKTRSSRELSESK